MPGHLVSSRASARSRWSPGASAWRCPEKRIPIVPSPRHNGAGSSRPGEGSCMLRTGNDYRQSLRDGREVWIDGERVADVTTHPAFRPIGAVRARMYDMAHEARFRDVMTYAGPAGDALSRATKPPKTQQDWQDKRAWVDA